MNARAKRYKIFECLKTFKIQPILLKKNRAMLRRIIAMSSNEDSRVMDCFCGGVVIFARNPKFKEKIY